MINIRNKIRNACTGVMPVLHGKVKGKRTIDVYRRLEVPVNIMCLIGLNIADDIERKTPPR